MRFVAPKLGVVAALLSTLISGFSGASAQEAMSTQLTPTIVKTIALSRCGGPTLSTANTNCRGFDASEIRDSGDIYVVGFENSTDLAEKHILQVVAQFDLSLVQVPENSEVSHATFNYGENSTTRRSEAGDSEYGVLQSCNTQLGVPTSEWNGNTSALLATRPAQTAGVIPATTGDSGTWDITPQVREWLASGQKKGTLVMKATDDSPEIRGMLMCLSYVSDFGINVEIAQKGS